MLRHSTRTFFVNAEHGPRKIVKWGIYRTRRAITSSQHSGYESTFTRPPSAYGWRYHLDNTIQFILWASFGSAAIHLLNIKQKYSDKERRLTTKIAVLKDIIRRVNEGEEVDVARELKTGKSEEEREWEEVMNSFREEAGIEIKKVSLDSQIYVEASTSVRDRVQNRPDPSSSTPETREYKGGWFWKS